MFIDHRFVEADTAALTQVIQDWKHTWPSLSLLALVPEAETTGVSVLQAVCRTLAVPLSGGIFPALLDAKGFRSSGVLLVCMPDNPGSFLLEEVQHHGAAHMRACIEQLQQAAAQGPDSHATLFLVFDAILPNIGTLLSYTHSALHRAPHYVGVNAGSETFQPMPCLFDGERLVQNGVLGLYFPQALLTAVHHAYEGSASQWRATSTKGNRIATINDRPAFEVYQEIIHQEYGIALTSANFYDYAVHYPFGLVTAVDILVRIPVGLGEDNSIVCVGEIAPNSLLRLLKAPTLAESSCAHDLGTSLASTDARSLLTFYCAGRRMHFGAEAIDEIAQIQQALPNAQICGALSLGEIDTLDGLDYPRFHNAAVVCLAAGTP